MTGRRGVSLGLALLSLLRGAAALTVRGVDCDVPAIVQFMRDNPDNATLQMKGCMRVNRCVPTSDRLKQDGAAAAGTLEATIAALRRFPDNKELQNKCIGATVRPILFNRQNGLRAGQLGGLNLTLKAFSRWMEDPAITSHGGDIGCYLDWVDENRRILRELGGVHLLVQNIKNNFHGQYSDWGYFPVKNSLFGLSSGCWRSSDLCRAEGFVELALSLMREHGGEDKIAEETLQAAKAMIFESDEIRREFSRAGLAGVLADVLAKNPGDRGAVSLSCEVVRLLVGPANASGPTQQFTTKEFDEEIQRNATRDGLMDQLIKTVMNETTRQHKEHGAFNFDLTESYNADADCVVALRSMAHWNPENARVMLQAGVGDAISTRLSSSPSKRTRGQSCRLLRFLAKTGSNATALEMANSCR